MAKAGIWATALAAVVLSGCSQNAETAERREPERPPERREAAAALVQRGEASYYHPRFHGREMANGERFNMHSNSAASRSLPLGTVARVRNMETGRTATVEVEDRGPYARGRILDVSPRTARELGMVEDGTAPVEITPIRVPGRDERTRTASR